MDFLELLERNKEKRPEHIQFCWQNQYEIERITVKEWTADVYKFADWIVERGIVGENIGLACANCYEWFVAFFAIILSGNTVASLNRDLSEEDFYQQIENLDIHDLFMDQEGKEQLPLHNEVEIFSLEDILRIVKTRTKISTLEKYCRDTERAALILYSSGTSGMPKGVMLSQKNILSVSKKFPNRIVNGRYLLSLPLYHIAGIQMSIMNMFFPITICICAGVRYLIRDIKSFNPTIISVVPIQLEFLAEKSKKNIELRKCLENHVEEIISLGAPLVHEYTEIFEQLHVQILDAYGLTEVSGYVNEWFPHKKGSIGRISDRNQFRLEQGEIVIRGESVMIGYYKNPEATTEVIKNGWFYTGDLAEMDEEGFLFLKGRKKNTIILSNGENISPEEMERKLTKISGIKEVIVTGKNQVLEAIIYAGEISEQELAKIKNEIEKMNEGMPIYRRIQKVSFQSNPLDKTGSGKIKRVY